MRLLVHRFLVDYVRNRANLLFLAVVLDTPTSRPIWA